MHRSSRPDHGDAGPTRTGEVILIGGGPGDPDLLTVGGLAALRRADVILTDRLAPLASLAEARPDAEVIDVGKVPGGRTTRQETIDQLLVDRARAGQLVVRLKGGDGFIFGRGGEEWEACLAAGVPIRVIPGVSASTGVPGLAGVPLTHRDLVQGYTVVSGHVPPGHPSSTLDWAALARGGTTLVIMMGVATLPAITAELIKQGMPAGLPAATIADGGLPSMRVVRGDLAGIAERAVTAGIRPPAITVIGAVAGLEFA
ncbi:uroporphyrinogen-III C-methyltransferase [Microlunatus speluncae]|uniref:uroporphyrinogen-III C-methyltransferase n=1 Tax=Microlunatus speluncae TaxID=2594267 RepID=UPI001FE2FCED|nr:uroporphyrinogen-III C-methyltransferase [Microlunatus speluncae]